MKEISFNNPVVKSNGPIGAQGTRVVVIAGLLWRIILVIVSRVPACSTMLVSHILLRAFGTRLSQLSGRQAFMYIYVLCGYQVIVYPSNESFIWPSIGPPLVQPLPTASSLPSPDLYHTHPAASPINTTEPSTNAPHPGGLGSLLEECSDPLTASQYWHGMSAIERAQTQLLELYCHNLIPQLPPRHICHTAPSSPVKLFIASQGLLGTCGDPVYL